MSRIAIISQGVSPRDAVGHDVREMQRLLRRPDCEVALFSSHWLQKNSATRDLSEVEPFLGGDPSSLAIYHHALGWQAAVELVARIKCRRVVRYHNVTPARFFAGYCPGSVTLSLKGRQQLGALAQAGCDLYLSASAYNQAELVRAGADPARCAVLSPFHQVNHLVEATADPEV